MSERKGKFIVFEGVDGSGKSTQAFLLTRQLGEERRKVLATREPGGTRGGERIREILLDPNGEELTRECELLLYMASRAQHVGEVLKDRIEQGYVVVCERYNWSSLAYQGFAGGLSIDDIEAIGAFAIGGLWPDLTIVLDMEPAEAMDRDKGPRAGVSYDRIEKKGVGFQERAREGFLELARRFPERSAVVDAGRPPKVVHEDVKRLVADVVG